MRKDILTATVTLGTLVYLSLGAGGATLDAQVENATLESMKLGTSLIEAEAAGIARRLMAAQSRILLTQDSVDALYRAARRALNSGQYRDAVEMFSRLRRLHARSAYAASAHYWEAFARYRTNLTKELEAAVRVLRVLEREYPEAKERREAELLGIRIRGELASRGDAVAAERVARAAAPPSPAPQPDRPPAPPRWERRVQEEETDIRVAALNALMQMDADRAIPILRQVLEKQDVASVELRRKALFLVSQKRSEETTDILLDVARTDPDAEVREQAVFWLSQVRGDRAVAALDSILLGSEDRGVQEKAIFALSQHSSERAGAALRAYARRSDVPEDLKEKAIFWLGQHHSSENQAFLRELYPTLQSRDLKERVIFALSQNRDPEAGDWLMDIALDETEPIELRKKALFWAGQSRRVDVSGLSRMYDGMQDREMREQIIFVLAQRKEPEAIDQLMHIAENDSDPQLQSKAVFWLGQSKDPRVPEFLLRLINRP